MIAGLAAAAVIVAGAVVVNQLPGRTTADGAPPTSSANQSTLSASRGPGTPNSSPGATGPDAPGSSQSKRFTTEVVPGTGAAGKLPKSTPVPNPVSGPLPPTASAVGSVAKGYPNDVMPAAPKSSISATSVSSQGKRLQASLTATTTLAVIDILAFYRTTLAKYGMYDTAAPALDGSTALTFTRGGNSVTLTATPVAGGSTYVVYGTFAATS